MNTYLKYQTPIIHFLVFLALTCGSFFIYFIVSTFFFRDVYALMINKNAVIASATIAKFKIAQISYAVVSFLFPALLFGYYSSPQALPYVGIRRFISAILLAATVALLFAIQPFIGYLGQVNGHIHFGALQQTFEQMEALQTRIMKVFLQMHSTTDLLLNLFIVALLPAVCEELFFRGALQKVLLRLTNKPWLAIITSASVFALLHGTFFKILPIFGLGLLLGTVYYITRNIWYTIILHFINNSLALMAYYYSDRNALLKKLSDENVTVPVYLAVISLATGIALIYFISQKSDQVFPKAITNDDNDIIA